MRLWIVTASVLAILPCTWGQGTFELFHASEHDFLVKSITLPVGRGSLLQESQCNCSQPFEKVDGYCFKATQSDTGSGFNYEQAMSQCDNVSIPGCRTNLVILRKTEKIEALARYVAKLVPERSDNYWYWVGAHKSQEEWKWENGDDVDLTSNIWYPGQPQRSYNNQSMYVRTYGRYRRLYALANDPYDRLNSFFCEATPE